MPTWLKVLLCVLFPVLGLYLLHRYLRDRDEEYRKSVDEVKAGLKGVTKAVTQLTGSLPRNFTTKPGKDTDQD